MPLQKRRLGRTRVHHRRSAWTKNSVTKAATQSCPNCNEPKLPHRICMKCGEYAGEKIIEVASAEEE